MLRGLSSLALEVKYLDRARTFYVDRLGVDPIAETDQELRFRAGETTLILRRPGPVPRGGLHVHYAFTTPPEEFDAWRDRFEDDDPEVRSFGNYRSLYVHDPDDHCVEIGGMDRGGGSADTSDGSANASGGSADTQDNSTDSTLTGIFEVVFEVEDLDRAESLYTDLGFDVVDRGSERRRVRLRGPFDLELWEPQLGIADARGGVHVDLGLTADDPEALVERVAGDVVDVADVTVDSGVAAANSTEEESNGVRFRDPDGHYVTIHDA